MRVVLVDYHKGNIKSVERSLLDAAKLNVSDAAMPDTADAAAAKGFDAAEPDMPVEVVVSDSPEAVRSADAIVLPGVGAFTDAMQTLDELGLTEAIKDAVANGMPFLGICLGLHLMFEGGVEHAVGSQPTAGLGFIPGIVEEMPREDSEGVRYKVPHVGWNSVEAPAGKALADGDFASPLMQGIPQGEHFYFTHSFVAPASDSTIATTTHSITFPSAVQKGIAFGVQFHPEKSSSAGLKLLSNFLKIAADANAQAASA